ncbi:S41 family peptidase [Aquimarina litoralis]|uniref:S41 family peptidase n=1 Tax=Aquimarina litoralis TaxID=584605 RepID=UPI001C56FA18|nr:S41 family peptidase [Aquimarina litoralis]MBW1296279.1 peptidase S41 [Aquimarina litoralis]
MFTRKIFQQFNFKYSILIISILWNVQVSAQQFSKKDVLSDLAYLKHSLEETHFNPFTYTSKKEFEQNYQAVKKEIQKDSLNLLEVTSLFQKVISKINNAHTRIAFPIQPYRAFVQSGGVLFPLEVAIENKKVLIRKNWSNNTTIQTGSELKKINGKTISEILQEIYPYIAAERTYFKNAQLESFTLPRYYWQVFGEQKSFEVEIIQNGKAVTYTLDAIQALEDYERKRDDILKHNWKLKFLSNSTAYLRPGAFGGDLNTYKQFIDSSFVEINTKSSKNLILDLRNNPGGEDTFSDYLVSYIADKPFKWASKFELKSSALLKENVRQTKDTTETYWKSTLAHKNGEIYEYNFDLYKQQPLAKRYQGNVYVLVNRQSYSQSTVTAAQIQDYGFGQIVGEETAEYPNLLASIFAYNLPKTNIKVDIAKGKIHRVNGIENNKGVIPDIYIKDYLLDETDEILQELVKKINLK